MVRKLGEDDSLYLLTIFCEESYGLGDSMLFAHEVDKDKN